MFTAIVKVEANRVVKFFEYDDESAAQAHCAEHGGFVYSGAYSPELWIDGTDVTLQPLFSEQEILLQQIEIVKTEIDEIERADLMNRRAREAFILQAEALAASQYNMTPQQLYVANPGYKGAKDVDDLCKAKRAQIKALEDQL